MDGIPVASGYAAAFLFSRKADGMLRGEDYFPIAMWAE